MQIKIKILIFPRKIYSFPTRYNLFNNCDFFVLLLLLDLVLGVGLHELPGVEDQHGAGDEPPDQVDDGHHRYEDGEAVTVLPEDAQEDNLEDDGEYVNDPGDHHGLDHPGLSQAPDQAEVEQDVNEEKPLKIDDDLCFR